MNVTEEFIDYLYECDQRISDSILKIAENCLLDYLGVTYAGASVNDKMISLSEFGTGECTIIGTDKKVNMLEASFWNGYNAHILELDDGHRFGALHLGAPIISALLAVAQNRQFYEEEQSGEALLRGIVLGYEAAARCAMSMQPGHRERGYHTSGTCGTIGAAVGIAIMLGYDKIQMKSVISGAATSAAGFLEIQEDSSEMKPYNIAHAAMAGVMASIVGSIEINTPNDILGGSRGVLKSMTDTFSEEKLLGRKKYLEIERIYLKLFAACRHCHPAMEAAIHLSKEIGLASNQIDHIVVYTYEQAILGHSHIKIHGVMSAKLSLPYCVAASYIMQSGGMEVFSEDKVVDEQILALTERVKVLPKEEYTLASPEKRVAEVHVFDKSNEYIYRVDYAKGDPENPMTEMEIKDKFFTLMQWSGNQNKSDKLMLAIDHFDLGSMIKNL